MNSSRTRSGVAASAVAICLLLGCTRQKEAKVPPLPPAEMPADLCAPRRLITDTPHMTGTYPRDVLTLRFQPEASQGERTAAVRAVKGRVIGGWRMGTAGEYFVQIPDTPDATGLFAALDILKQRRQVRMATPVLNCMSIDLGRA